MPFVRQFEMKGTVYITIYFPMCAGGISPPGNPAEPPAQGAMGAQRDSKTHPETHPLPELHAQPHIRSKKGSQQESHGVNRH